MNILWSPTPKHILTMIVDHRIISSANNTALLTLRYCLECIHVSIYAQVKAWANSFIKTRATTRICAKKPFIVIDYNCHCFGFGQFPINNCVLYSPGWTNLKTTIKAEILPLNFVNDQSVTFFVPSECLSAKICCSSSSDKSAKRATCEFFSASFLLLVGKGPKRLLPIEKLGSSSLVSSIFQREGKLHCSLR